MRGKRRAVPAPAFLIRLEVRHLPARHAVKAHLRAIFSKLQGAVAPKPWASPCVAD